MRTLNFTFFLLCITGIVLTGCSDNVSVKGKVLLQSGQPVTKGLVLFESDKISGISDIKSDGSYSIGLVKPGEGIPPGTYNIAIQATGEMGGNTSGEMESASSPPSGMSAGTPETSQVDNKYTQTRTSGLSITVEKGKPMDHDIIVAPPDK